MTNYKLDPVFSRKAVHIAVQEVMCSETYVLRRRWADAF